jgi:hypothetical protein
MAETINAKRTGRFIEWWGYFALAAWLLTLLMLIFSPLFQRNLLSQNVTVSDDEPVKLQPVKLRANSLGALRVDAQALIRTNEWVTFEIQLLDKAGKIIVSGIKEGWNETGTWNEEGESGDWAESDTLGGLDVRGKQDEELTVAIALLEYGTVAGKELDRPVNFQVNVKSGVMDGSYLWLGTIGSFVLAISTIIAVGKAGKKVISEKINDSDPTGRATLGGIDNLVRLRVEVEADETTPQQLEVCFFINNEYGERIYAESAMVNVSVQKDDGKFKKATAQLEKHFILNQRGSYGFHVEVFPDEPIHKTRLIVRDKARTLFAVDAVELGITA